MPAPAGVLRVADFTDVTTFDPTLTQVTQASYLYPVYDTLLRQNEDRELVPHLATNWTVEENSTFRFSVRDDVVFHDGSRFDASVVKLNLDRAKAAEGNPYASTFAGMSAVEVVDPTTVEVRFDVPNPSFLLEMSLVQGMMVSPDAISGGVDLTREPHGSGGWMWNASDSQDGVRQVFDLNPDYWAPELQGVERLEISTVADNAARFNALRTGQVDLVNAAAAADVDAAQDEGFDVVSLDVDVHFILITDRDGRLAEPLADPRVRRAIGHAIDRDGYVQAVLDGVGSSTGGLVSPALDDWYDESLADMPAFDPELASALLSEAGYPDGFDLVLPSLQILQTNNEAIAQMLGEVGIRVELAALPPGQLGPELRKGSFAACVCAATQHHPHQWFNLFVSNSGPYNPFAVDDTRMIDTDLAAAAGADDANAAQLYSDVQRETLEAGIALPIAFAPVVNFVAPDVANAFMPLGMRNTLPYELRLSGS
jgi:peptide/nickel transport system substrate-binding protein